METLIKWILTVITIILAVIVIGVICALSATANAVGGWGVLGDIIISVVMIIFVWSVD